MTISPTMLAGLTGLMGAAGDTNVNQNTSNTAAVNFSNAISNILGGGTAGSAGNASGSQSTTANQPTQALNPGVTGYNGLFTASQLGKGASGTSLADAITNNGAMKMVAGLLVIGGVAAITWFVAKGR